MRIKFKVGTAIIAGFVLVICALIGILIRSEIQVERIRLVNEEQDIILLLHDRRIPHIVKYTNLVKALMIGANDKLTAFEIVEIAKSILVNCEVHSDLGLTPEIILAVIERESGFNPDAISYAKAYGLMQVIRSTAELHLAQVGYGAVFSKELILNPIINVEIGMAELVRLRRLFLSEGVDGWLIVLTAYFWGERNAWELLNSKKRARLPSLEYGKSILELAEKWRQAGL